VQQETVEGSSWSDGANTQQKISMIQLTVAKSTANAVGSNTIDFFLWCRTWKACFLAEEEAFDIGMFKLYCGIRNSPEPPNIDLLRGLTTAKY
jgi:hypothetical protein